MFYTDQVESLLSPGRTVQNGWQSFREICGSQGAIFRKAFIGTLQFMALIVLWGLNSKTNSILSREKEIPVVRIEFSFLNILS